MIWIQAIAGVAALFAAGAAFMAGLNWLDASRVQKSWSQPARDAAMFTGYGLIAGVFALFVFVGSKWGGG